MANNNGTERKRTDNLLNMEAIAFQIRESYKTARTNIAYSIIKKGCKKISFTSANKSEGKTVTSVNICEDCSLASRLIRAASSSASLIIVSFWSQISA